VAIGLWFMGLPAAVLFGLVSGTLRFIPYLGPWVAALLPTALSLAVFDDWNGTLLVIAYLASVELVSNNVFEPLVYGASVGLSPFAVIIAAVFWTWLWGSVGLVLAIPLTVCLVVLGRYVPQLQFLAILLGDEPALAPAVRLFQRLLAQDTDEADELVETECREHGIEHACDTLVLPALSLVDYERRLGRLDEEEIDAARRAFDVLLTTLERCVLDGKEHPPAAPANNASEGGLLCLPAGAFGDEIVCDLLVCVLGRRGLRAEESPRLLTGEMLERVGEKRPQIIVLSALPPSGVRAVRYLCRRLLALDGDRQLVVGMWGAEQEADELRKDFGDQRVRIVTTFADACRISAETLRHAPPVLDGGDGDQELSERPARKAGYATAGPPARPGT
jgi:hypothetical protein